MDNFPMMDGKLYDILWLQIHKSLRGLRDAMGKSESTHIVNKMFADVSHLLDAFVEVIKHVNDYVKAWKTKEKDLKVNIALLTQKLEVFEGRDNAVRAEATYALADRVHEEEVDTHVENRKNPQAEARCAQKTTSQPRNKTSELHPVPASEIETRILRSGSKQPLRMTIPMETQPRTDGSCDQSTKNMQTTEKGDGDLAQNPSPSRREIRKSGRLRLRDNFNGDPLEVTCDDARRITPDESQKRETTTTVHPVEKTKSFEQVDTPVSACHKRPLDFVFRDEEREERSPSPSSPNKDGGKRGRLDYDKEQAALDEICGMMAKYTQRFRQKAA